MDNMAIRAQYKAGKMDKYKKLKKRKNKFKLKY